MCGFRARVAWGTFAAIALFATHASADRSEESADSEAGDEEPEYGATAEVEPTPHAVVSRSVEAKEAATIPGVRGDAIKSVEVLPGISRSGGVQGGTPLIRGAGQIDSQVFLDGAPVPLLFHAGGITSFFQSRLLDGVEVQPGNFSARYGRLTGGIIDAHVREPRRDRLHAMLDLSVLDSAALVEAPLGKHAGIALAARRSNIDFFFRELVPDNTYSVVAAPVYYDYQALASYDLAGNNRLSVLGYGSRDAFDLVFAEPNQDDPALRGSVGGALSFHHLNARLDSRLSKEVHHSLSLTGGILDLEVHVGPLVQQLTALELYGRSDWGFRLAREIELDMGVDFFGQLAKGRYVGPRPGGMDDSDPSSHDSPTLADQIELERSGMRIVQPALWLELVLTPIDRVAVIPSVRADFYENASALSVDPRLAMRAEVTDSTTLKAGVGFFSQPPQWYELLDGVGNPDLKPFHALHWGAGVEQQIVSGLQLGIEGFYKRIFERVVSAPGGRPPYLVNDGQGRIVGLESSLKFRPSPDTLAFVAYTLSRSERRDGNGRWYLFDSDQTHVLSAVASQKLGAGWEVGARFRYVTGNPQTPVVSAVYDARVDQYRPIYGRVNSERAGAFYQLDLRVEKTWRISDLSLSAYLEVMNATNAQNPEGSRYSYDYRKRETVSGLPILPNLGIRGEI